MHKDFSNIGSNLSLNFAGHLEGLELDAYDPESASNSMKKFQLKSKNSTNMGLSETSSFFTSVDSDSLDQLVELLAKNPSLVDTVDERRGTALFHAQSAEAVSMLVRAGVNVFSRDAKGNTALQWVNSVTVANALLDHGIPVNSQRDDGASSLHLAVYRNRADLVAALLNRGADVGITDIDGQTPLHVAARDGNVSAVRSLLEHGANLDARDGDNLTPLLLAVVGGHRPVVEELLSAGANANIAADTGLLPLDLAITEGSCEIIELLQQKEKGDK